MKIHSKFGSCEYAFESDFVHIYNLYIIPEYRNKGYAKAILLKTISEIRKTGYIEPIQIVANPTDISICKSRLKKFYQKLGLHVFDYYG